MSNRTKSVSTPDRILKWIGVGALVFGALPVAIIAAREMPGIIRELKLMTMGGKGGWKQAHQSMPPYSGTVSRPFRGLRLP
jgi:hypothetical protein